ncbi:hypothetical protein VZT92_002302 [Zoarces viviparus]
MAKAKAKTNNRSAGVAPPQPRSLRSRKRACPSDENSEIDDVQAAHHQDAEVNHTTMDATLLQCHHSPQQESTVKAFDEQEETKVTDPSNDSQLKGFKVHADNDANKSGKDGEEMTAEEYDASPSQTCTDQLQVCLQISEEDDAAAPEDQPGAEENPECNFEKNQEVGQEEPSNVYTTDVKETAQEAAAGLPAKKKRRMGMCGLTERERSHFLQTKKRDNGQNGPERVGKQICNNAAVLVAQEEIVSSLSSSLSVPVGNVTEQEKAEMKLHSSHSGGEDRAEAEVHIAATASDGTSVVCDPGGSKGTSCEVEADMGPGPEQSGDTKSDLPAEEEEEEEELLGNQVQQEHEGGTAESAAEKPQEQVKDGEDGSAAVVQSPAFTFSSNTTQSEETEKRDAIEAAPLQVSRTREEELTGDAEDDDGAEAGASSTHTQSGGLSAVQLCEAAVTPGGPEKKDSWDSDGEPGAGPSTVNTTDPFGSGYLDDVSDSQLNAIILTEEVVMEEDHEDATDLICGLIRELSSLNRTVMATHRELENRRRRSSKSSRGCKR